MKPDIADVPEQAVHSAAIISSGTARELYWTARKAPDVAPLTAVAELWQRIHLASAFQLLCYPHVIGTLWPINDGVASSVAEAFYLALRAGPLPSAFFDGFDLVDIQGSALGRYLGACHRDYGEDVSEPSEVPGICGK